MSIDQLSSAHRPRILIVEDQYFVAIDSEINLTSAGFECIGLATNADEAMTLATRCKPDLVLMDIRLANGDDGLQVALDLYREFGVRCIFTSGHADDVVRGQARPARPLGWLPKPYSNTELLRAVKCGLSKLADEGGRGHTGSRDDIH